MRVDGWFGEQTNRMIESFEISLWEQKLAFIANCALEPSSNNGYSTQGTIYKIIYLNRLARQSTLPGKKFDQSPLNPKTDPVPRQSPLRSSHCAEVNHGQTEPLFCVPQFE
jgi:hypothetical protein